MVAVGVVVLLIVVGVLCIGAVEVDCTGVTDILVLGFLWWRWWKKWNCVCACGWVSLWDNGLDGFFCPFGT